MNLVGFSFRVPGREKGGGGGNVGNPKNSYREDWGTFGMIRGITTPVKNPIAVESCSKKQARRIQSKHLQNFLVGSNLDEN